ncbi:hypothetical protein ACPCSP_14895 [Streptomyces cinereoruber]|uniref:hypothetical protein n=1 Tax=Streptomyces cinereoruber TaxID=67260 RepID=UPI0036632821
MDLKTTGLDDRRIAATRFVPEEPVKNQLDRFNRIFAELPTRTGAEAITSWRGTRSLP